MTINRANIAKNLWPGIKFHFGDEYKDVSEAYKTLFDTESSTKAFEEMVGQYQFALAPIKREGTSVSFDEAGNAWTVRAQHNAYALGFIITREAVADDQYFDMVPRYTRALKRSMRITKEVRAAAYYGLAFSATQLGGDGVPLVSASHPLTSGGTLSNVGASGDLSETSLEAAITTMMLWTDERGLRINIKPKSLHVAPSNHFTADRILGSSMRPGTADNDINVLNQRSVIPGGSYTNSYFTDPLAWFLRTDCSQSMIHFDREKLDVEQADGSDNQVIKVIAYERYSFVHADWRGVYGQSGT
jgi:hypothetical protein